MDSYATSHMDEWIQDSGGIYHICSNQEFFFSLEALEDRVAYVGNDTPYKIKGICKVKLQIHDGTISHLGDIQFVLDINKNLISLRVLVDKGLQIT